MDNFLENLRAKPAGVKKLILWATSGSITLVIVLIWFLSGHAQNVGPQTASVSVSPWQEIKNSTLKMYQSVSDQYGKLKIENK